MKKIISIIAGGLIIGVIVAAYLLCKGALDFGGGKADGNTSYVVEMVNENDDTEDKNQQQKNLFIWN